MVKLLGFAIAVLVFWFSSAGAQTLSEKARLDNFAIQLLNDETLIGYVLVFDSVGGCPGEAGARAIRAKKYVVEHRGVAWNRVIWRHEGYLEGLSTMLQPAPRQRLLPFPFLSTVAGKDGPLNRTSAWSGLAVTVLLFVGTQASRSSAALEAFVKECS